MYDYLANMATPLKMFKPLMDAGGKVVRIKLYLTHYRSHRKIVAINYKIGYIGGMNIGQQYANLAKKEESPARYPGAPDRRLCRRDRRLLYV